MVKKGMFTAYGMTWPRYKLAVVCVWCGYPFGGRGPLFKTREHVVPRSAVPLRRREHRRKEHISASHSVCNKVRNVDVEWRPYTHSHEHPQSQKDWLVQFSELYEKWCDGEGFTNL